MTFFSAQVARWGLLVTTLGLGATLIATGIASYMGARTTASAVTRTIATDLLAVRRDIRDVGTFQPPVLDILFAELEPRGARYIAIVAPEGVLAAAGESSSPVQWQPPGPEEGREKGPRPRGQGGPPPPPEGGPPPGPPPPSRDGGPPPGPAQAPPLQRVPGTRVFRTVGWLEPPLDRRREPTAADRRGPIGPERATIVIEFEPLLADTITKRALAALATQIVATGVLLAAAVVFWRHSRRSEAVAAQAERDRHLRSLGEMSAVLGHELRNPLASLKGHAQLLLEKLPADHAGRRGATTIVEEAVRLEGLANQVLEFVKTGTLRFAAEDPVGIAAAAIEASGVDGVRLTRDGAPASWLLDRVQMEQVLANLLKNARDASPGAEPIDLRVGLAGGDLLFDVSDRGEGLPPGDEARAFEPFFTTRVHGTGLGLAVAKRIVEGHGGTIRADNRDGGGAVFRITLPPGAAGRP